MLSFRLDVFAYVVLLLTMAIGLSGCKTAQPQGNALRDDTQPGTAQASMDEAALSQAFQRLGLTFRTVAKIEVDVENTTAFWSKIDAVRQATRTIDIAYFLYGDDYAGSYLGKELIAKANATPPVKIRMMVDAKTTMKHRAFFKMLVAKGKGNIEVAYFRPVPKVIHEDFERLGLDPAAFVAAITAMDTKEIDKQIAGSPVLKAHVNLMKEFKEFVRVLSQPGISDGPTDREIADAERIGSGPDAHDEHLFKRIDTALKQVKEAHAAVALQAKGKDWFDLTKWTHHKLLLVDGKLVQGGGRNLEDAYHWEKDHAIRVGEQIKKYVFMDVDYRFDSEDIGRDTLVTYDKYMDPSCVGEPPRPQSCVSQIAMGRETAASDAEANAEYEKAISASEKYEAQRNYQRTYDPVHTGVFSANNARVAYAENTMLPGGNSRKLLTEEPSKHNAALVAMIDATRAGQEVVIQNAYVYLPMGIQVSLMRALQRGVNVTLQSNSPESSDLGYIAQAARLQYREFLKIAKTSPGKLGIYEYLTEESLHSKVEIIGDRFLVVGSINADPRCEYLDTNNGVIIDDPALATQYKSWLTALRTKLLTERTRTLTLPDGSTKTIPLLRHVDEARIAEEDANQNPDQVTKIHRNFKGLAAKAFRDDTAGASARTLLQSMFLQY